jgi:hypothetical protein
LNQNDVSALNFSFSPPHFVQSTAVSIFPWTPGIRGTPRASHPHRLAATLDLNHYFFDHDHISVERLVNRLVSETG